MPPLTRLSLVATLLLGASTLTGCQQMMSCVVSNVFDPQILGPFVNVPSARDVDRTPDTITTTSPSVYFLWMNPDMEEGDTFRCEILTVTVEGLDAGTVMGSADGVAAQSDFRGPIMFSAPQSGWLAGSYEAAMSRNGEVFDSVSFEVLP